MVSDLDHVWHDGLINAIDALHGTCIIIGYDQRAENGLTGALDPFVVLYSKSVLALCKFIFQGVLSDIEAFAHHSFRLVWLERSLNGALHILNVRVDSLRLPFFVHFLLL